MSLTKCDLKENLGTQPFSFFVWIPEQPVSFCCIHYCHSHDQQVDYQGYKGISYNAPIHFISQFVKYLLCIFEYFMYDNLLYRCFFFVKNQTIMLANGAAITVMNSCFKQQPFQQLTLQRNQAIFMKVFLTVSLCTSYEHKQYLSVLELFYLLKRFLITL